jgi:CelD/BcsL family acetyltransferase involved in cellulose biosynthesis
MRIYLIDPLTDPRWDDLVARHSGASAFHTRGWLEALRRTYGYEPSALTASPPGTDLTSGLPFCVIRSWFARRVVSLPFSDHCEPLAASDGERQSMFAYLSDGVRAGRWTSVELRFRSSSATVGSCALQPAQQYAFHALSLAPSADELFGRFHRSCVQRAIRRAERERLEYTAGVSAPLLDDFYRLLRLTRRRHGLPPQPKAWFRNVVAALGSAVTIRIASKAGVPVAGILTLTAKNTIIYKYGCSDATRHNLGGMPFLFWRTIQESKRHGLQELDLGRSDLDEAGLITFKDRLGAFRSTLSYHQVPGPRRLSAIAPRWRRAAKRLFQSLPDPAVTLASRVLYRHLG